MSDDISIPHATSASGRPGYGQVGYGQAGYEQSGYGQPGFEGERAPFTHSYRARRTGMDSGTRRLVMAASGLGLVLLAGMGAWTLTGRRAPGVPTIEADSRPLRMKPTDPGGMTVIGANDQVMSDGSEATGDLAPAAEKPDPQALRAQRQAQAVPVAPAVTGAPGANPAAPAAAPSAPTAATAAAPARTAAASGHATPAGGPLVQIAAVDSSNAASAEWARLAKKMPELLGDRRPVVQQAEAGGKAVWRIRTAGFADTAEATQFCQKVRAKGVGCSLANF